MESIEATTEKRTTPRPLSGGAGLHSLTDDARSLDGPAMGRYLRKAILRARCRGDCRVVGLGLLLYLAASAAAALTVFAGVVALWTWFVLVVLRREVVRSGRPSARWTVLVYFTGVFGLIAWDVARRRAN